ncbi:MAG: histidine kinase [Saprospiraceae bacterium]|nr:histidine kinase [Saprospiraceae bacterium]|tara:strand:+ start:1356 stop:2420 length:1065 start_codon:yes stop_codon:yes gene_type:complete
MRLKWNWTIVLLSLSVFVYLDIFQEMLNMHLAGEDIREVYSLHYIRLTLTTGISMMAYSIVLYHLLQQFYRQVSTPILFLILAIAVSSIIAFRYILEEILMKYLTGSGNYNENTLLVDYYLDNTYYAILFGSVGAVYFFIKYAFKTEREKKQLEIEHKATQLQYLRSQINPHFLFNSLNNIYSLVYKKSDKALPSIDKLSKLLRYSLYEIGKLVIVKKEIEQINRLMELEQLRREDPIKVNVNFDSLSEEIQVPTYLLLPFVENAYKHGDLHNENQPVQIDLKIRNDRLIYSVSNHILDQQKDADGGIGLSNIKKRLDLIYSNDYDLEIINDNKNFKILLDIPVKSKLNNQPNP